MTLVLAFVLGGCVVLLLLALLVITAAGRADAWHVDPPEYIETSLYDLDLRRRR